LSLRLLISFHIKPPPPAIATMAMIATAVILHSLNIINSSYFFALRFLGAGHSFVS